MADPITIRVLTNAGLAIEDSAVSVVAPGGIGYLGVLRNHAPLVTTLQPGTLRWRRSDGETRRIEVRTGLLEVVNNEVTVLTDQVSERERVSTGRPLR